MWKEVLFIFTLSLEQGLTLPLMVIETRYLRQKENSQKLRDLKR